MLMLRRSCVFSDVGRVGGQSRGRSGGHRRRLNQSDPSTYGTYLRDELGVGLGVLGREREGHRDGDAHGVELVLHEEVEDRVHRGVVQPREDVPAALAAEPRDACLCTRVGWLGRMSRSTRLNLNRHPTHKPKPTLTPHPASRILHPTNPNPPRPHIPHPASYIPHPTPRTLDEEGRRVDVHLPVLPARPVQVVVVEAHVRVELGAELVEARRLDVRQLRVLPRPLLLGEEVLPVDPWWGGCGVVGLVRLRTMRVARGSRQTAKARVHTEEGDGDAGEDGSAQEGQQEHPRPSLWVGRHGCCDCGAGWLAGWLLDYYWDSAPAWLACSR